MQSLATEVNGILVYGGLQVTFAAKNRWGVRSSNLVPR